MWYKALIFGIIVYSKAVGMNVADTPVESYKHLLSIATFSDFKRELRNLSRKELTQKKEVNNLLLSQVPPAVCTLFIEELARKHQRPSRDIAQWLNANLYIQINEQCLSTVHDDELSSDQKVKKVNYFFKKEGASPNYSIGNQQQIWTALWYSVQDIEVVRTLLTYGANPDLGHNQEGQTLLFTLARYTQTFTYPNPENNRRVLNIPQLEAYFNNLKNPLKMLNYCKKYDLNFINNRLYPKNLLPTLRILLDYKANPYHKDNYDKQVRDYLGDAGPLVINAFNNYKQLH